MAFKYFRYYCDVCDLKTTFKSQIKDHMFKVHTTTKQFDTAHPGVVL